MADYAAHAHKIRLNLAANHKRGTRTVHGDSDTDIDDARSMAVVMPFSINLLRYFSVFLRVLYRWKACSQ